MKNSVLTSILVLGSWLWFPAACRAQIPASFFGMHTGGPGSFPLKVKYGQWRNLSSGQAWWRLNTCDHSWSDCRTDPALSSFRFDELDAILGQIKAAGVNDVFFTLSNTPTWAAAYIPPRGSETCTHPPAGCILPPDIDSDGSGTNAVWDNWVENIALHVNNPTWLQTHAHIKYWEPWNEVFSDHLISFCCASDSSVGTYAQHLRLTEDTRCLITGTGTVHNYPSAGSSTPCSSYLKSHHYSAIDPGAQIVLSSMSPGEAGSVELRFVQNFLYCSDHPKKDLGSTTSCTWSGGLNWMSAAVDVINFHLYMDKEQPESNLPSGSANNWVGAIKDILSPADRAKPLWNGEGSGGTPPIRNPHHIWGDSYSIAGFVIRYAALLWSAGVSENFWFMYNTTPVPWSPLEYEGNLLPAGTAFNAAYQWLVGSTPTHNPFCSSQGTVWTCPFSESNGKPAELVWDSQYGPGGKTAPTNCSTAPVPTVCGATSYTVPALYSADWVDMTGTSHPSRSTLTIGAVPILLQGSSPTNPRDKGKPQGDVPK